MKDVFSSSSFYRFKSEPNDASPPRGGGGQQQTTTGNVQMSAAMGANLNKFSEDVEGIKDELKEIEKLHQQLHQSHEQLKTIHNAKSVKDVRSRMDSDISLATKKAKLIKVRLEALDRYNAYNRTQPGCGPGSSPDRTRTSDVNGLRKKLKDSMERFNSLRQEIGNEYKETVKRRILTITGESPDDRAVEMLISSGESKTLSQKAIQEQGRGTVMATVSEIKERFNAVKDIEKSLMELHQVFLDMAVMVEVQGEHLDDIESQVGRASSFISSGTEHLQVAKKHQRSTRKWTCIAIIILVIVILTVVLPIVFSNTGGSNKNSSPNLIPNPTPPTPTPNATPPTNPTPNPNITPSIDPSRDPTQNNTPSKMPTLNAPPPTNPTPNTTPSTDPSQDPTQNDVTPSKMPTPTPPSAQQNN